MTTPINPGIRRTVAWLNAEGFNTTDSGDGVTHDFECDRAEGYVAILVPPLTLVSEAARLLGLLRSRGITVVPVGTEGGVTIHASYDPADDSAVISVEPIADADVTWPEAAKENETR